MVVARIMVRIRARVRVRTRVQVRVRIVITELKHIPNRSFEGDFSDKPHFGSVWKRQNNPK